MINVEDFLSTDNKIEGRGISNQGIMNTDNKIEGGSISNQGIMNTAYPGNDQGVVGISVKNFKSTGNEITTSNNESHSRSIETASAEVQSEITRTIKKPIRDKFLSNQEAKGFEIEIKSKVEKLWGEKRIKKVIVFIVPDFEQENKIRALIIKEEKNEYLLEMLATDRSNPNSDLTFEYHQERDKKFSKEEVTKKAVKIELDKQSDYLKSLFKERPSDKNERREKLEIISLKLLVMNCRFSYIKSIKETETETDRYLAKAYEYEFNTLREETMRPIDESVNNDYQELKQYIEVRTNQQSSLNSAFDSTITAATIAGVFVKTFVKTIDPGIGDIIEGVGAILKSFKK